MTLESMINTHGYWAVLVGTFFEGETVLLLGGFAASQGYLVLRWVIVVAFFGTLCADQLFFFLGRRYSQATLVLEGTLKYYLETVFSYPTLAEAYKVAALDAWHRLDT